MEETRQPAALGSASAGREKPLVTVVVRAYQRRARALRAIRSALAQTLADQPVLVVDDGSTDGTAEAVGDTFGARVRVLRHGENRGPGAAANTGIAAVETPFVAFLDSDDLWHPRFLEIMVGALQAAPESALAYCTYRRAVEAAEADMPATTSAPAAIYFQARCPAHSLSTVVARTRALRAVGPLRTDVRVAEDFDLLVRLWLRSPEALLQVDRSLVTYTLGTDNVTESYDAYLAGIDAVCERYAQHPAFRPVAGLWRDTAVRAALTVAERRNLARWLAAEPNRSASLVLVCPPGSDDATAAASLGSAAAQRLPPMDGVVIAEDAQRRVDALAGSVPFPLYPVRPEQGWPSVLAVTGGSLFALLAAGDAWSPDSLDRYRRAFSATTERPAFVYGGLPERPEPPGLAAAPLRAIQQVVALAVPGSLSAMAVLRRTVNERGEREGALPLPAGGADWLALAAGLAAGGRRAVRVRRAVVAQGLCGVPDTALALRTLQDLAETERGRWLAGLRDALDDSLVRGDEPFANALEEAW